MNARYLARKRTNALMLAASGLAVAFGLAWLIWILGTLLQEGGSALLRTALYVEMTPPPGADGGLANAITGSLIIVAVATLLGTPVGVLAGTYLAEYGKNGWLASATRFLNDVLLSAPSIVIGLFVYSIYVAHVKHFSAWAGAIALRHPHRHPPRHRPHQRRNGAAALHLAQQPVLVDQPQRADGQSADGDLPVRHEPVCGLAPAGLGRRGADYARRAGAEHPGQAAHP
jgi:ABC-type phosphate transport system permease subunit